MLNLQKREVRIPLLARAKIREIEVQVTTECIHRVEEPLLVAWLLVNIDFCDDSSEKHGMDMFSCILI